MSNTNPEENQVEETTVLPVPAENTAESDTVEITEELNSNAVPSFRSFTPDGSTDFAGGSGAPDAQGWTKPATGNGHAPSSATPGGAGVWNPAGPSNPHFVAQPAKPKLPINVALLVWSAVLLVVGLVLVLVPVLGTPSFYGVVITLFIIVGLLLIALAVYTALTPPRDNFRK